MFLNYYLSVIKMRYLNFKSDATIVISSKMQLWLFNQISKCINLNF